MEIGKIPENVLKRSVLNQIRIKREEVIVGAGIGEDCAILALKEGEVFVLSTDPITGASKDIGKLAIHVTINDLASAGAEPIGVLLSILLPENTREVEIKKIMEQVGEECAKLKIQTIGGHTEITTAVNMPIITVTGVGKAKRSEVIITGGSKVGQDIVLSKWIGLEGTTILAKEYEKTLREKFSQSFIDQSKNFDQYLSVVPEAACAVKSGVSAMHDVTEGGIFGALWEIAESASVGLEVDIKKIPVQQETIEICEYFGINPYYLISSGAMLMVTDRGHDLVKALEKIHIHGTIIGKITSGNDRVVLNGEDRRFLEPPKSDEIYHVKHKEEK